VVGGISHAAILHLWHCSFDQSHTSRFWIVRRDISYLGRWHSFCATSSSTRRAHLQSTIIGRKLHKEHGYRSGDVSVLLRPGRLQQNWASFGFGIVSDRHRLLLLCGKKAVTLSMSSPILQENGADIDLVGLYEQTCLHLSIRYRHEEFRKWLISWKTGTIFEQDAFGSTRLHHGRTVPIQRD
jgi:hypothetical protein